MFTNKIDREYFLKLIDKYLEGNSSLEEKAFVINYFDRFQNKEDAMEESEESEEEIRLKILNRIRESLNLNLTSPQIHKTVNRRNKIRAVLKSNVFKYAAIFIVTFGIGSLLLIDLFPKNTVPNAIIVNSNVNSSKEITLSLANGNVEVISENRNRKLYGAKGEVVGVQKGNQLSYTQKKNKKSAKFVYNELTIPHGKIFDLILSDGTTVKLNAGTSIKYPVHFIEGKERKVFIKGEAYFDVAKDKDHPFIVNANNINVEVLGTEFNMSFYPEDNEISTVLVEGTIRLYESDKENLKTNSIVLSPGDKAAWSRHEKKMSIKQVDVRIYTAWKSGDLLFKNTSFGSIIKKLERKFNVTIDNKYRFLEKQIYTASFLDNETIEDILEYFSEETSFNYTMKNNKLTIISNLTK